MYTEAKGRRRRRGGRRDHAPRPHQLLVSGVALGLGGGLGGGGRSKAASKDVYVWNSGGASGDPPAWRTWLDPRRRRFSSFLAREIDEVDELREDGWRRAGWGRERAEDTDVEGLIDMLRVPPIGSIGSRVSWNESEKLLGGPEGWRRLVGEEWMRIGLARRRGERVGEGKGEGRDGEGGELGMATSIEQSWRRSRVFRRDCCERWGPVVSADLDVNKANQGKCKNSPGYCCLRNRSWRYSSQPVSRPRLLRRSGFRHHRRRARLPRRRRRRRVRDASVPRRSARSLREWVRRWNGEGELGTKASGGLTRTRGRRRVVLAEAGHARWRAQGPRRDRTRSRKVS